MPIIASNALNNKKIGMDVQKSLIWAQYGLINFTKRKSMDSQKKHEMITNISSYKNI